MERDEGHLHNVLVFFHSDGASTVDENPAGFTVSIDRVERGEGQLLLQLGHFLNIADGLLKLNGRVPVVQQKERRGRKWEVRTRKRRFPTLITGGEK